MTTTPHSDVFRMICLIKDLDQMATVTVNYHSQQALLVAMMMEAQTLKEKLKLMTERWAFKVPFKEAVDIDFVAESREIRELAKRYTEIDNDELTAEKDYQQNIPLGFLIDFAAQQATSDAEHPFYEATRIRDFLASYNAFEEEVKEKRSKVVLDMSDYCLGQLMTDSDKSGRKGLRLELHLSHGKEMISITSSEQLMDYCGTILRDLADLLLDAGIMRERKLSSADHIMLAEKVMHRHFHDNYQKAYLEAMKIKNVAINFADASRTEIKKAQQKLRENPLVKDYESKGYFNFETSIENQKKNLGKYLEMNRATLTIEQLTPVMDQIYLIYWLRRLLVEDKAPSLYKELQPSGFAATLRANEKAWSLFLEKLSKAVQRCSEKTGPHRSKWKWSHLYSFLTEQGYYDKHQTNEKFGRDVKSLFPDTGFLSSSVARGINPRNIQNSYYSRIEDDVKSEMEEFFKPVKALWRQLSA